MQLELHRKEYMLVGLTSTQCLKVLPLNTGIIQQQKIAVADQDGVLQLFSLKKGTIQIQFKTLPGPSITVMKLAGAIGTTPDKIFIACGNEIRGYNKKGKLFLSFNTNLTENITCMYVIGSDLFVCGNHVYNHYRDCKDIGSYLCGDKIVDIVAVSPDKSNRLTSVLACEGRMLRVLEHSRVIHSIEIDSSPTVLHIYNNSSKNNVLYGTLNGHVGVLQIGRTQINNKWILTSKEPASPIACIESFDIIGDGISELLLARQDGTIEVYALNIEDFEIDATLIYTYVSIRSQAFKACNENVTAIQGGMIGHEGYNEIVVCTYTGRIFGLTTELVDKNAGDSTTQGYVYSQETQNKITKLRLEIEELEQQLNKERERYQMSTQAISEGLSAIPVLAIKDSMILRKEDASYLLTLEVQTAIDNILLQSDVPLDLLDVEKNSAVISNSICSPKDGNYLLVTYRCQANTNRLEIQIRTIEGQAGTLQVYVTPLVQPKCCQVRQYRIRPLSLHMRIHNFDPNRPYNVLKIQGGFSMAEVHSWISNCFPEVPEKPSVEDSPTLTFQSTFVNTIVHCTYKKGEAQFQTDNISTMSIIKDFISKEGTKRKVQLSINYELNEESIKHTIKLLHPKLEEQVELSKKVTLLRALKELDINDPEHVMQLSKHYQEILQNEKELISKLERQPKYLDRLYGLITDLYVDKFKFKGVNIQNDIPKLIAVLDKYDFDSLINFFYESNNKDSLNENDVEVL